MPLSLLLLPILAALFWVFVVLPQRRLRQAHDAVVASLAVGQQVMTASGIYGRLTAVDEVTAKLEVAPDVVIKIDKQAVGVVFADAAGDTAGLAP